MKNNPPYLAFSEIESSVKITEDMLIEEIKSLPLDMVLGYVAVICCGFDKQQGLFDRNYQVPFLIDALVDDFPVSVRNMG